MNLADINFAQPQWLWGLLLVPAGCLWYIYCRRFSNKGSTGLEKFADQQLLPHLLLKPYKTKQNYIRAGLYALLISLIIVAMANPRWSYEEIDAYAPTSSMVILLDLNEQMTAKDIAPSRMNRARQSIEDLLNASRGLKVGLIGFAANPHLISPITDDIRTLKTYLPALDTTLISKQGHDLAAALDAAEDLLQSEPGSNKSILLISDGNFADTNYKSSLAAIIRKNIKVHVVGIGTTTGAPFYDKEGKLYKHNNKIVNSKLNQAELQEIAKLGNGVYVEANYSLQGIQTILDKAQFVQGYEHIVNGKIRQWEDRYYLLLLPAAIIICILLMQRAFYLVVGVITLGLLGGGEVHALQIQDLFKNSEQRGKQQFAQTNFKEAADLFQDPYRKGIALYRAGDYVAAEQQFKLSQRDEVHTAALYNMGNAQMQQRKWRAAIDSYEKVLKEAPDHTDAQHNLELAKKMLKENPCDCEEPNKEKQQDQDGKDQQNKNDSNSDKSKEDQQQNNKAENDKQQQDKSNPEQDPNKNDPNQNSKDNSDNPNQDKNNSNGSDSAEQDQKENMDPAPQLSKQQQAEQEARAQQWLNRINSDIKVFLHNKFYIEDIVGESNG